MTDVNDAAGRSVASINPLGNRSSSVYDAAGQVIAIIHPLGNRISNNYDAVGRSIAYINPPEEILPPPTTSRGIGPSKK